MASRRLQRDPAAAQIPPADIETALLAEQEWRSLHQPPLLGKSKEALRALAAEHAAMLVQHAGLARCLDPVQVADIIVPQSKLLALHAARGSRLAAIETTPDGDAGGPRVWRAPDEVTSVQRSVFAKKGPDRIFVKLKVMKRELFHLTPRQ